MALLSKFGSMLRHTVTKQTGSPLTPSVSRMSLFQVIRSMTTGASSKLFIGGISFQSDEQSLRDEFAKYGEVVDVRIITDRDTGRSRGFGFVTYTSSEEASSAIQALDGNELHGRRVRVNYATDRPRNNFGGGGGGYGGGGDGYGGGGYGGGGYGGSGDGYNSTTNYASVNTFDNSAGGFGAANNSFPAAGAGEPLEGNSRDADDTGDFKKRA